MNENVIKQPLLPDTIHFNHTRDNDKTEVMRITRDGVWVNPDIAVDETAKAVLDALSSQVRVLVQRAVEDEREACANLCEKMEGLYEGDEMLGVYCADAIRERGEK
jgi:hypothetical protein